MSNIDYIINICHDIHQQGKTPSVALIRNSAASPLSIPETIKALQSWKSNPKQGRKELPEKDTPIKPISLEQRVEHLERQLQQVLDELTELRNQSNQR